jgi:hypothetical protein
VKRKSVAYLYSIVGVSKYLLFHSILACRIVLHCMSLLLHVKIAPCVTLVTLNLRSPSPYSVFYLCKNLSRLLVVISFFHFIPRFDFFHFSFLYHYYCFSFSFSFSSYFHSRFHFNFFLIFLHSFLKKDVRCGVV